MPHRKAGAFIRNVSRLNRPFWTRNNPKGRVRDNELGGNTTGPCRIRHSLRFGRLDEPIFQADRLGMWVQLNSQMDVSIWAEVEKATMVA